MPTLEIPVERFFGNVTHQNLHDCGLNPFAVQLLGESLTRNPLPENVDFAPFSFVFLGVRMSFEKVGPPEAPANDEPAENQKENPAV